jgi:hypothetical protein
MSRAAVTRLAAFALVVAGSFGTAYAVGQKLPGNRESKPHTHGGATAASTLPPAFAADGYVLFTDATQPSAATMALHLNGPDGSRVTDFADRRGAQVHVVLIHPDLSGFQHVQPDIAADGGFVIPIQPGPWRIIVDSQPVGAARPVVLATSVDDETAVATVALPKPSDLVTVDGLTITRLGLSFTLSTAEGVESYLGQPAYLVAVRRGDLAYTNLDTAGEMPGMFMFSGSLTPGTYRLFLQFGYHGKVLTVPFTVVQP